MKAPIITLEEWASYVDAITKQDMVRFSTERGWRLATVELLKDKKQIAKFNGCWAFPNIDPDGDIRSIHYRIPRKNPDEKADWKYDPTGAKTHPLIWGDPLRAAKIAIHESQWDAITQVDKLGLNPFLSRDWAIVSTRGATNAKALREVEIGPGAHICVFPQNDEAGGRWQEAVLTILNREVFIVSTPPEHKDLNDCGRNGLTPQDLEILIQQAVLQRPKIQPKTQSGKQTAKQLAAEALARRLEAEAEAVAHSIDGYYDVVRKEYALREGTAIYQSLNEAQFKRVLRARGLSRDLLPDRQISQLDIVLDTLRREKFVQYVGPLAGRNAGYYHENGIPFLVTNSPTIITPRPGNWNTIDTLFTNLLSGPTEPWAEHQKVVFYGWLQVAYNAARAGKFQPGQALAMAGPVDAGKSLTQKLITLIVGDRSAKAAMFLQGRTDFNSELFGAEHLYLEDENVSTSHPARMALAVAIKSIVANQLQQCHAKGRDIVNLSPWWRITISLNDRSDRMMVLPPLEHEDIAGKIILLRATAHDMPMCTETMEEKQMFWETLTGELPAFLHWLTTKFEIPIDQRSSRFGVGAWHHPELLTELDELSPASTLLELIDRADIWRKFAWNDESQLEPETVYPWTGTALELRSVLLGNPKTKRDAEQLLNWTNATGQYLNDLAKMYPTRIKAQRTHTKREYEIWPKRGVS